MSPHLRTESILRTLIREREKCLSSELSCYVQSFHVHNSADLDYALRKFWEFEAIGMNNNNNEVYTPAETDAITKVAASQCYTDAWMLRVRNTLDSGRKDTGK